MHKTLYTMQLLRIMGPTKRETNKPTTKRETKMTNSKYAVSTETKAKLEAAETTVEKLAIFFGTDVSVIQTMKDESEDNYKIILKRAKDVLIWDANNPERDTEQMQIAEKFNKKISEIYKIEKESPILYRSLKRRYEQLFSF